MKKWEESMCEFYNEKDDLDWVFSTHCKDVPNPEKFKLFLLYGNEDNPAKVEFYLSENPDIDEKCYIWERKEEE